MITATPTASVTVTSVVVVTPTQSSSNSLNPASCSPTTTGDWISPSQATSVISEFCAYASGKAVPPSIGETIDIGSGGSSAAFSIISESEEDTCENATVDEDECILIYDAIVSECTTSNGEYYGGELSQGCLDYIL